MREWRFQKICEVAAFRMRFTTVFCPIAHSHPIAIIGGAPGTDWEFWARQDLALLDKCDRLTVARLPGYDKSKGVQAEITYAMQNGIPVQFTDDIRHIAFWNHN